MTKFSKIIPSDNYILHITTDDNKKYDFNVLTELERIPSYRLLYDKEFFKQVKFKGERIYWDNDHDFHIDQVLARSIKVD